MFVALAIMQPRKCPTARGPAANKRPLVAMRAEVTVQIDAPCKRALAPGDWAIILRSLAAPALGRLHRAFASDILPQDNSWEFGPAIWHIRQVCKLRLRGDI
jgi:hypothetical protein